MKRTKQVVFKPAVGELLSCSPVTKKGGVR